AGASCTSAAVSRRAGVFPRVDFKRASDFCIRSLLTNPRGHAIQVPEQQKTANAKHGSVNVVRKDPPNLGVHRLPGAEAHANAPSQVAAQSVGVVPRIQERAAERTGKRMHGESAERI